MTNDTRTPEPLNDVLLQRMMPASNEIREFCDIGVAAGMYVGVGVPVWLGVRVAVGVCVIVGVWLGVRVWVTVRVGVIVRVCVIDGVCVTVGVEVTVRVFDGVRVTVGVEVGVCVAHAPATHAAPYTASQTPQLPPTGALHTPVQSQQSLAPGRRFCTRGTAA